MKNYICLNHGECHWADENPPREFTLDDGDINCPNCNSTNIKEKPKSPGPPWKKIAGVIGVLLLILGIIWLIKKPDPDPLVLNAELDCQTRLITLSTIGGNEDSIVYRVEGLSPNQRGNEFIIPDSRRNNNVFLAYAVQNGIEVSKSITSECLNPVPLLLKAELNCRARLITLTPEGGDNSLITYSAEGLNSGAAKNVFRIPTNKRNGTIFTFHATQNGKVTEAQVRMDCPSINPPVQWSRVVGSEFCDPPTCTLIYSEIDNLGHTREQRINNYTKCCPAYK
ncbi:hypothetical protein GCM10028807_23590 [Spirosoma daeguense]